MVDKVRMSKAIYEWWGGRSTSLHYFYCITEIYTTIVISSKYWIGSKLIMAEWETVVTKFTVLTLHHHYSTSSWKRASYQATVQGKPSRIVMISTIGTLYQQCDQEMVIASNIWDLGIFHWWSWMSAIDWEWVRLQLASLESLIPQWLKWTPAITWYVWHPILSIWSITSNAH